MARRGFSAPAAPRSTMTTERHAEPWRGGRVRSERRGSERPAEDGWPGASEGSSVAMSDCGCGEGGGGGPWLPVLAAARRPPDCDDGPRPRSGSPESPQARWRGCAVPRGEPLTVQHRPTSWRTRSPFPGEDEAATMIFPPEATDFFMVGRSFVLDDLDLSSAELNFYGRQNSEV